MSYIYYYMLEISCYSGKGYFNPKVTYYPHIFKPPWI